MTEQEDSDGERSDEDLSDDANKFKKKMNEINKRLTNKPPSENDEAPAGDFSSDDSGLPSEFEDDDAMSRPGQRRTYAQANNSANNN